MDTQRLLQATAPHQHLLVATPSECCDFAWTLQKTPGRQTVIRTIRGSKARTTSDLFDEFAAALQFPYYFGENWDALDECLADLAWLPGDLYILFFTDSQQLLDQESVGQLALLFSVLENADRTWSGAERRGSTPRRPFHAVFQCAAKDVSAFLARVEGQGRTLNRL
jgi:RNAse (barnase) inhibitor barstar